MRQKSNLKRLLSPRARHTILAEALEPRTLLSTLVVNGTAGDDTIALGVTAAGGVKVIVNGSEKDYAPGQWTAVQVDSGTGNDTINVKATVVPTAIGGEGSGTVNVGDANGVQDIKAALRINGFPMGTDINADDTGDATARTVDISATPPTAQIVPKVETIAGLAPVDITFTSNPPLALAGQGLAIPLFENPALSLTTGSGDDTVNVRSTLVVLLPLAGTVLPIPFVASLTLNSSGGADTVNVGNNGLTNEVHGNLLVRNAEGHTTLNIDDSADTAPSTVTLSVGDDAGHPSGVIDGLTAGSVTFRASDVSSVTLDGGKGGNTFTVNNTPTNATGTAGGPTITLNTGAGNDQVTVDATGAGTQLKVDGGAGNDTLTVPSFASGVNGNIAYDGGVGSNTLVVGVPALPPGSLAPIPLITVMPGLITQASHTLSYTDVQTLHLENAAFQVKGNLGPLDLVVGQTPAAAGAAPGLSFVTGPTSVELNASQDLHALDILDGIVTLSSGGNKVLNTDSLSLGAGVLDLTNNSMQVHYGMTDPFQTIRGLIFHHQIRTSVAGEYENLGYADSADHVVNGLADNTVLVKFALDGDTNLDGTVNFDDLVRLVRHYGMTNANWDDGDFNYDGKVFFDDFVLLARNYGRHLT